MISRASLVSFIAMAAGVAGLAKGAVIASYPFTSASPASTDTEPNSFASNVALGPALTNGGFSSTVPGGSFGSVFARSDTTPNTEALAVTNGSYFGFTVTPNTGYELDLSSLTFSTAYGTDGTITSSDTTASFFVRTSLDNFTTTIGGPFTQNSQNTSSPTFNSRSVDLSGALFQNISSIAVRIYVYDGSTNSGRIPRVTNVVLNGEVPLIPEPSALAGLSMLGGLLLRRRAV